MKNSRPKSIRMIVTIHAAACAVALTSGCTKQQISISNVSSKSQVLANSYVMGSYPDPGAGSSSAGGTGSYPGGSSTGLPLQTYCAGDQSYSNGSDLTEANVLLLTVKDASGSTVCSTTSGVRDSILNNRIIDFSVCPSMTGNNYSLTITDPNSAPVVTYADSTTSPGNILYYSDATDNHAAIAISRTASSSPWVVTDAENNNAQSSYALILSEGQCQTTGDPLIIDTAQDSQNFTPVDLSSPAMGILFDILGVNAMPAPHSPMQISWFRNHNYMFVVLPDASGNVHGIDQLFGNNTIGPDGQFAANGFLALAKYDSNHDGVIDAKDPIFSQLRLWSDKNYDGVSQPGELYTLDQMGIVSIDLNYDSHYYEKDQYGNEVKYKSVAQYADGSLHLLFDLWFTLKGN